MLSSGWPSGAGTRLFRLAWSLDVGTDYFDDAEDDPYDPMEFVDESDDEF